MAIDQLSIVHVSHLDLKKHFISGLKEKKNNLKVFNLLYSNATRPVSNCLFCRPNVFSHPATTEY